MNNTFDLLLRAVDAYTCRECCDGKECGCFFYLGRITDFQYLGKGALGTLVSCKTGWTDRNFVWSRLVWPQGTMCRMKVHIVATWQIRLTIHARRRCDLVSNCSGIFNVCGIVNNQIKKRLLLSLWVKFFLNRWIVGYKQERDCFVHFLRLLVVCWLGALSAWDKCMRQRLSCL